MAGMRPYRRKLKAGAVATALGVGGGLIGQHIARSDELRSHWEDQATTGLFTSNVYVAPIGTGETIFVSGMGAPE